MIDIIFKGWRWYPSTRQFPSEQSRVSEVIQRHVYMTTPNDVSSSVPCSAKLHIDMKTLENELEDCYWLTSHITDSSVVIVVRKIIEE